MKKILSILLLLLTIGLFPGHAQQMPITVTPILTPPYTPSLSRMCESGSTSLMVNVFVNDVTVSDLQVRLHLKLESTGITIESVSKAPVRPISVGGGEARVLMGDDLAEVLALNNLTFKGYDKSAYLKTGALPGGIWRLTAWLEHYHTGRILSNKGSAMAVIASYPPPVLTSPNNNEVTSGDISKPVVFTWNASKFMGGTASLLYTLEMWEMRADGVPAEAVVASQTPIYTAAPTAGLTHTLIPASLAMEPGMRYCWRVTVSDPSGKAHIQNGGHSEVRVFQYLDKCPDICDLNIAVRDVTATASWDPDSRHKGGWNVEMYDDAGTYHKTLWTGSCNTGSQSFDYGTRWHVRVQGVCQSEQVSAWSEWKDFQINEKFSTPKRDDGSLYECGDAVAPRDIANMEEMELKKGDIIENERGTTKYEIYSATRNDDGSYRGLSYMILSIWNCKVLGEYDHLKVNTDGVVIDNFSWRSQRNDLLMLDPDAIKQWTEDLAQNIAGATYNNTIKETIKLDNISFETIVHKDDKYYAIVKDENGNILDPVDITSSVNGKTRVAIEDKDGKQLVVDKNGEMMGVEEYKYCGGSALQLKQYNAERDSLMSTKSNVIFDMMEGEEYGFDKWRGEDYDKDVYPTISRSNDYRPSYMGIEKGNEVKVKASYTKGLTFKNERGVPLIADKENNTLTFNAGMSDQQAIYAYDDTTVVGKLDVQAYSYKDVKVHLVRVNNTKTLDLGKIEKEVNDIWQQAVVKYTFDELEPITIDYANKEHFVHGGKGTFQNYNTDQKTAIQALPETADCNDYYLFFTDCYDRLDTAGVASSEPVSGYMPVGRHYGFIYNEFNNARTIAHELGHGVNSLHHTFSDDSESFHTTAKTDNLMDYNGGKILNHNQWKWSHEKHRNVLGFLDGEEESEGRSNTDCWNNRSNWERVSKKSLNQNFVKNKKELQYVSSCSYAYSPGLYRTYFELSDGRYCVIDQVVGDHYSSDPNDIEEICYIFDSDKNKWNKLDVSIFTDWCLMCELTELGDRILKDVVLSNETAAVAKILVGVVAFAAAIPSGGTSLTTLGALGVSFGVTSASYTMASGTAELVCLLDGREDLAAKIPSGYLNATVGLVVEYYVEDQKVVETVRVILGIANNGKITFSGSDVQKLNDLISCGAVIIDVVDLKQKDDE